MTLLRLKKGINDYPAQRRNKKVDGDINVNLEMGRCKDKVAYDENYG